jgi:hypothetical protein
MDTGEIKAEVRDLSRRVDRLERPPKRVSWNDLQPWVYGLVLLGLALAGKVEWNTVLHTLRP